MDRQGRWAGVSIFAFRAGPVAGLTLSGIIIGLYGWRALFYLLLGAPNILKQTMMRVAARSL